MTSHLANKPTNTSTDLNLWPLWLSLLSALTSLVIYIWKFHENPLSSDPEKWGPFGDFLGGTVNPIIASCTLYIAIRLWQLQRTELKATQIALREQSETAKKDRIEQRFFDLMNFYHQSLESFQFQGSSGKSALTSWLYSQGGNLRGLIRKQAIRGNTNPTFERIEAIRLDWLEDLKRQWGRPETNEQLSHYFRVVFRILSDAETILGDDRYRFIRLFRAQLSQTELFLIGLNLWGCNEGAKMAAIAEEYGLLKHMPAGDLRTVLEGTLQPKVFGRKFSA